MSRGVAARCTFCLGASEQDNPFGKLTQPKEHAVWRNAFWALWEHCQRLAGFTLKEETPEQREFALLWRPFHHPFRLRIHDVIRIDGRLGRVIRVTDCAAVVLFNPPPREFITRFDRHVRFRPAPVLVRICSNTETEVLNRKHPKKRKPGRRLA